MSSTQGWETFADRHELVGIRPFVSTFWTMSNPMTARPTSWISILLRDLRSLLGYVSVMNLIIFDLIFDELGSFTYSTGSHIYRNLR